MGERTPAPRQSGRKGGRKEERMSVERGIWVGRSWWGGAVETGRKLKPET